MKGELFRRFHCDFHLTYFYYTLKYLRSYFPIAQCRVNDYLHINILRSAEKLRDQITQFTYDLASFYFYFKSS
jgi:hypothetical protein